MKTRSLVGTLLLLTAVAGFSTPGAAAAGSAAAAASAPPNAGESAASAAPAGSASPDSSAAPSAPGSAAPAESPHAPSGAHGSGAPPGDAEEGPPRSGSMATPLVPAGTIVVRTVDAQGRPVGGQKVELLVHFQSVAQGEKEERRSALSNAEGLAHFSGLSTGPFFSYVVATPSEPARFETPAFQLEKDKGQHALLFVFPVAKLESLEIRAHLQLYVEPQDNDFTLEGVLTLENGSLAAWVAGAEATFTLPEGAILLESEQHAPVDFYKAGSHAVQLRGTITPGRHQASFRCRLPNRGTADVSFPLAFPPIIVAADVYALAARGMRLQVPGGREMPKVRDRRGLPVLAQRVLSEQPLTRLDVSLSGLPLSNRGAGPATALALLLAGGGGWLAIRDRLRRRRVQALPEEEYASARELLLAELVALTRAHGDGQVGPETFARTRTRLLQALARLELRRPERAKADGGKRRKQPSAQR